MISRRSLLRSALLTLTAAAPWLTACAGAPRRVEISRTEVAALPDPEPPPDWRLYFDDLDQGAVLVDVGLRRLHYWGQFDSAYRSFPIGVAERPEFVLTGATTVVRKRENPDWRPTPDMIARNPDLPRYVPPGPDNPLGQHALYLGWRYYAIHGTNDPTSIGRATTSGCIRMFPQHIAWLYARVDLGAPVYVTGEWRPPIRPAA